VPFSRKAPRVQTLADALHTLIENRYSNCHDITMVCHSLGGLIGKQYLIDQVERARQLRVKSLLLFAVPNNGAGLATVGACISWRHGQLRQLCRDSDLVRTIATTWQRRRMADEVDVCYVVAALDRVVDECSARESWGNIRVEVIPDCDHRSIVKPRAVTDLSYLILRNTLTKGTIAPTGTRYAFAGIVPNAKSAEAAFTPPQQDVRVAMSALIRIASGDKYVLVRNLHRPESFAPFGGVYKYFREGQVKLDSLNFRAQATDADMVDDIRGFLPYKHLDDFMAWFNEGHGRESAQECLRRELQEETAQAGLKTASKEFTGVRFAHVRTVNEGLEAIAAEAYLQLRVFDVYDVIAESARGRDLLRKIQTHATVARK
jgi:hypothetical protein